ncbi:hypothetical protein LNTAR_06599 [Lentisphaera araneosa HTCC2155]|uniref:Uncharacterized protein n=1 Tax=Lentisphaera araneosa HTCC2155 TaxID=313628 RepID=A6DNE6_9BACT|nr:hypothetical protein [Lentisphaera araneosa]EDM26894.1 hypothetical protein LNTAR_06599 [Lentisphaera araneosa HTCC2155]
MNNFLKQLKELLPKAHNRLAFATVYGGLTLAASPPFIEQIVSAIFKKTIDLSITDYDQYVGICFVVVGLFYHIIITNIITKMQMEEGSKTSNTTHQLNIIISFKVIKFYDLDLKLITGDTDKDRLRILTVGNSFFIDYKNGELLCHAKDQEPIKVTIDETSYTVIPLKIEFYPQKTVFSYTINNRDYKIESEEKSIFNLKSDKIIIGSSENFYGEFGVKAILLSSGEFSATELANCVYKLENISADLSDPLNFTIQTYLTYNHDYKSFIQTTLMNQPSCNTTHHVNAIDWVCDDFPEFEIGFLAKTVHITGLNGFWGSYKSIFKEKIKERKTEHSD